MPKFRKKPIIVEAEQWFPGKKVEGVREYLGYGYIVADGYVISPCSRVVEAGDWVITDIADERYPCKDAIFRATHETVEEG